MKKTDGNRSLLSATAGVTILVVTERCILGDQQKVVTHAFFEQSGGLVDV